MHRVITIVGGGFLLAACASSTPNWFNVDARMDTVQFESEPPGAEAKISTGQTCRTPCSLALPAETPITVTFTLNGYMPESEQIEVIADAGQPRLRPNPVMVELSAAPPSAKKPGPSRKKPTAKPKSKAKPAVSAKPAAQPASATAPGAAPWPATQPVR